MKNKIIYLILTLFAIYQVNGQTLAFPAKIVKSEYIVDGSGGEVKLIASELIQLKPGVKIKTGSKFIAQIKENYAVYPSVYTTLKFPSYTQLISDELIIKGALNQTVSIHTILIYDKDGKYQWQIKPIKNQDVITVDFKSQVAGLYHLILIYSDGTNKELKVLKY